MEHHRQAFSGDCVQNLLHQDQALSGREIRDAPTRDGKAFTSTGGAMFRFRLDKSQLLVPKIMLTISDFGLVPAAHRRGRSDRVRACTLSDMSFHPNHHSGTVGRGRNPRIRWFMLERCGFPFRYRGLAVQSCAHALTSLTARHSPKNLVSLSQKL